MNRRILRYWTYIRRGHAVYLAFFVSLLNFVIIQYRLLVQYMPQLASIFPSLGFFALCVTATYVPIAATIGWLDYKRYGYPMDSRIMAENNPWTRDLARALYLIASGGEEEAEEARRVLERWMK